MPKLDRLAWPLITATALAGMVAGHALELWLENLRVFGDGRSDYVHFAQSFALEVAGVLALAVVVAVAWRLLHSATHPNPQVDFLLPALHRIVQSGFRRIAFGVITIELASLMLAELAEQRLSGFAGSGLLSIVGPGHATALAVHLIVGLIAAFALYSVARYVCTQTGELVRAFTAFLRWARELDRTATPTRSHRASVVSSGRKRNVIALGLANRPPPSTSAFVA